MMKHHLSKKARHFIAHRIKIEYGEHGRSLKQSIAIGYAKARKHGFKVPKAKR